MDPTHDFQDASRVHATNAKDAKTVPCISDKKSGSYS